MDSIVFITSAVSTVSVVGLGLAKVCYKNFKQHREMIDFLAKRNDELEETIAKSHETFETNAKRIADQSRRIAWLETRVRQPKLKKEEAAIEEITVTENRQPVMNMTERRYRITKLASMGQSTEKIAATLGLLPGEVELIINLNRVAV